MTNEIKLVDAQIKNGIALVEYTHNNVTYCTMYEVAESSIFATISGSDDNTISEDFILYGQDNVKKHCLN